MILVIGASGYMGRAAVRQLLEAGHRVRAASRTPEKIADLGAQGAEIVKADLVDPASLASACAGASAVLAAAHSLMGTGRYASDRVDDVGHRALIDAAKAAGVKRFVYTSAMGASADHVVDFVRTKAAIERYLAASGLEFTILRPSAFMEWHVHNLFGKGIAESGKATIFGSGNNPSNFVAAGDVAAVAVHALTGAGSGDATVEVGGPDNLTRRQVAELYAEQLGRPTTLRQVPLAAMRIMAPLLRPFSPVLSRLVQVGIWADTANQTFDVSTMPSDYPRPATRVREFIARRLATAASPVSTSA